MSYQDSLERLRKIKNAGHEGTSKPSEHGLDGFEGSAKNEHTTKLRPADIPLAAKLRALGCPIALEVEGEVVCWLVADEAAAVRASVGGAVFTAAEAEVLSHFSEKGIRDLCELKARFGGMLQADESINERSKT